MARIERMRRTQFIITYGPGSILESRKGPRLIPRPDIGLFYSKLNPKDFEINERRIKKLLGMNKRVFQLPSEEELLRERVHYITRVFPEWWVCPDHGYLFPYSKGCPECKREGKGRNNWDGVRFVRACSAGHLDDVDWHYVVHGSHECRPDYYIYESKGPSMSSVKVKCPKCGAEVTMEDVYGRPWPCSGRRPEVERLDSPPVRGKCDRNSYVILRQSSYLRVPVVYPLFTLPPVYTEVHRILEEDGFCYSIVPLLNREDLEDEGWFDKFKEVMERIREARLFRESSISKLLSSDREVLRIALKEVCFSTQDEASEGKLSIWEEEFKILLDVSVNGAPPVSIKDRLGLSEVLFEAPKEMIREEVSDNGRTYRLTPITKLRSVIIQVGYLRPVPGGKPELVDVGFTDSEGVRWYPGVKHFGEGLFITSKDIGPGGPNWERWNDAFLNRSREYEDNLFLNPHKRIELNPLFVWWHTFSHLLIRSLSQHSGYSSASLRERVYVDVKRGIGGVLIYTVQPGDGSLGGLISLTPKFKEILSKVQELASSCPNDPLCSDQEFSPPLYVGAACYACTYLSETSCEYRNMWLDRHLLMEVPP